MIYEIFFRTFFGINAFIMFVDLHGVSHIYRTNTTIVQNLQYGEMNFFLIVFNILSLSCYHLICVC